MLGVLALSVIVGLMRGVVLELLSLAGWVAAWFGGGWLAPWISPWLPFGTPGSALQQGLAFAIGFLIVLVVWGIGARLVSMLIKATPLRPIDRLLGAVFGIARGVVVLLVAAMLIAWSPAAKSEAWRSSIGAPWLDALLHTVLPMLPEQLTPPPRVPPQSARSGPAAAPALT